MQLKDHSIKQNIPKLAVDGSNWVIFHDRLLWVLDMNSLSEHLVHNTIPASYTNAGPVGSLQPDKQWWKEEGLVRQIISCYDLSLFLLIYFLFCLSLCATPCLALFAFLCACFIAYLCVVLGHILHDT